MESMGVASGRAEVCMTSGEWVESMGVASGVVSRRWVWLVGGIYGYGYNV